MDATECFKDHQACAFDELIEISVDEEVIDDDVLALMQLQSCAFEVEVDVQMLEEFCDWIFVRVRLLLDDLHQILEGITTTAVDDNSDGKITQDVRAGRLNNVQVNRLVQQHFDDQVASFRVMEEDQHAPMDQPSALCQKLHVAVATVVDELTQAVQILQCRLPVDDKNFSGQLSPQDVQVVLVVGLHNHQADVQVGGGLGVVSAIVHVLSELVNALDDVDVDLKEEIFRSSFAQGF